MQTDTQATLDTTGILEQFQSELVECWGRLPNKAFFFSLLGVWLLLFQVLGNSTFGYVSSPSLFRWMINSYNAESEAAADDAIGNLIPFIVLGLFWWKRKELLSARLQTWLPALGIVFFALVLHVVAYVIQQPRFSIVALFGGIYGLMGLAWGFEWLKRSFFPFVLFAFSVPLGTYSSFITVPLALLVSWMVEVICSGLLNIDIIRHGNQLWDPTGSFKYEVAAACSGIRSLTTIFLMAVGYGFVVFRSGWKRAVMTLSAVPLAVLGNLTRMLCIVIAADFGGQEWGNRVHDNSWISLTAYIPAILGVLWLGRLLEKAPDNP